MKKVLVITLFAGLFFIIPSSTIAQKITCNELLSAGLSTAEISLFASLAGIDSCEDDAKLENIKSQAIKLIGQLRSDLNKGDVNNYNVKFDLTTEYFSQHTSAVMDSSNILDFLRAKDQLTKLGSFNGLLLIAKNKGGLLFELVKKIFNSRLQEIETNLEMWDVSKKDKRHFNNKDKNDFKFRCQLDKNDSNLDATYNQNEGLLYLVRVRNGKHQVVSLDPNNCKEVKTYDFSMNGHSISTEVFGIAYGNFSINNDRNYTDNYYFTDSTNVYLGRIINRTFDLVKKSNHGSNTAQGAGLLVKGGPVLSIVHNSANDYITRMNLDEQLNYSYSKSFNVPASAPYGLAHADTHYLVGANGYVYGLEHNTGKVYEKYKLETDAYISGIAYNSQSETAYIIENNADVLYTLDVSDLNDHPIITDQILDGELLVSKSNKSPNSTVMLVDVDYPSGKYSLLRFDLDNMSDDEVTVSFAELEVNTDGINPDLVIDKIFLLLDGNEIKGSHDRKLTTRSAVYDFLIPNIEIDSNETISGEVKVIFHPATKYPDNQEVVVNIYGDGFTIDPSNVKIKGSALSAMHTLVSKVSNNYSEPSFGQQWDQVEKIGTGNHEARFVIGIEVTAGSEDIYLPARFDDTDLKLIDSYGNSANLDEYSTSLTTSAEKVDSDTYVVRKGKSKTFTYSMIAFGPEYEDFYKMVGSYIKFRPASRSSYEKRYIKGGFMTDNIFMEPYRYGF